MSRALNLLPIFALLLLHGFALAAHPGLHFDEAWALNYAHRIAEEPGFWPLTAMSPYTAPWAHYWAALWMKLLGSSLLVFRGSQAALSLAGLGLLSRAAPAERRAGVLWAACLIPALALNHRFAIELTGWHTLCFGLLAFSLARRSAGGALAALLLGSTAHILFYGVGLGLAGAIFFRGESLPRPARTAAVVYFLAMALFFSRMLPLVPEKGKAAALVVSALLLEALFLFGAEKWNLWRHAAWRWLAGLACLVFLGNALCFAPGLWSASIATGYEMGPALLALNWLAAMGLAYLTYEPLLRARAWERNWFFLATAALGVMMLKPAPRYYELVFLALAWFLGQALTLSPSKRLAALPLAACVAVSAWIYLSVPPVERNLRWLFFKDSSRDFLDKQSLAGFLGGSGCALSDIHTHDPRLAEELRALSYGDWTVAPRPCAWNFVSRRLDGEGVGEPFGDFLLRRK